MGDWRSHKGGKRWRIGADGFIEVEGEGRPRTPGEPVTMRTMLVDYGPAIKAVDQRVHEASGCQSPCLDAYLATICALESSRIGDSYHRDPASIRLEPDYESDEATPGEVSPGLMQTLLSTAEEVRSRHALWTGDVTREDLFVPLRSMLVAGFYLFDLADRYRWDPVLLSAAYNAGGVYESDDNRFNLRVYDEGRPLETIEFWNDFQAVRRE